VLIACRNDTETTRFGFSVGKRIGKAVVRNKVKRRLRELARSSNIPGGWDLVFIARKDASTADFQGLNGSMSNLLERAGLLKVSNQELNDSKGRSIPAE
jgi:ribonuclease P protein component